MSLALSSLPMPEALNRRLALYMQSLSQPRNSHFDFATPVGEPAIFAADSLSWRVYKNPITLFIGGITAITLELAEPQVRAGLLDPVSFKADAIERLQSTSLAVMAAVYAAESRLDRVTDGVARRRERAHRLAHAAADGDPILENWVYATSSYGFMEAYSAYARHLTETERNHLLAEGETAAKVFGVARVPSSLSDMDVLFEVMRHRLEKSPEVLEFLEVMKTEALLPAPLRYLQGLFVKAAVEILPPWVRDRLDLWTHWSLTSVERKLVNGAVYAAEHIILPSSPPVQACKRLGLPKNYLYRQPKSPE